MTGRVINYYTCANSALGFVNLFEDNLKGLDKIFILKGGPGTGKSTIMKNIGSVWKEKGYDVEYIHCSSDNNSIDGVIIPKLKAAVVDGTAPHVIEPTVPGAIEEYINLGVAWDSEKLAVHKNEILDLKNQIAQCYKSAYEYFAAGIKLHDEWEQPYIKNLDFSKMNELTQDVIELLLGDAKADKKGTAKNRFFGGSTPMGPVDFVMNITDDIGKRYYIKGRPGSGKSTMLKKIAAEADSRGFDTEVYHCGFDPKSLDMVVIRELDVAIFDSTSPHEYYPCRDSDTIIDVYATAITPGTDEKYEEELNNIISRYRANVNKGIQYLADAKALHDAMEKYYIDAMDFEKINEIQKELKEKLEKLV